MIAGTPDIALTSRLQRVPMPVERSGDARAAQLWFVRMRQAFVIGFAATLQILMACSSDAASGPSCKPNPVQCQDLVNSSEGLAYCVLDYGCSLNYSCAGTASCKSAPDSFTCSQLKSVGCSNAPSGCIGAATPCDDAVYQKNSEACADVGCTLTRSCGGGPLHFPCDHLKTQTECETSRLACTWK
jgi:hypothetical protein